VDHVLKIIHGLNDKQNQLHNFQDSAKWKCDFFVQILFEILILWQQNINEMQEHVGVYATAVCMLKKWTLMASKKETAFFMEIIKQVKMWHMQWYRVAGALRLV
jgi:hypothetical protein